MPAPKVVATLPFSAAATKVSSRQHRLAAPNTAPYEGPATLSFADAYAVRRTSEVIGDAYSELLEEATDLARRLGCEVRQRLLGGAGGGARWVEGRLRVVLDAESSPRRRLEVVAAALRGDQRLRATPMSVELLEYLNPRRAA